MHNDHVGDRKLRCGYCRLTFRLQDDLILHHKNSHTALELEQCQFCCQKVDSKQMIDHVTSLHSNFVCLLCSARFSNEKDFGEHGRIHAQKKSNIVNHKALKFHCDHCTEEFSTEAPVVTHLLNNYEANISPIQCSDCVVQFEGLSEKKVRCYLGKRKLG